MGSHVYSWQECDSNAIALNLIYLGARGRGGGGGTPLYDLYRYVPLDRVWFLAFLS